MKLALIAMLPLLLTNATAAAAQAKPRGAAAAPTTATITVTDASGTPIPEVRVILIGALDRSGSTQSNGTVRFDTLRAGTYRLRFEKDGYVTFERELEIRAGQPAPTPSVTLSAAPPPPAPPPEPEPEKMTMPPPGKAMTVDVTDFLERNFITNSQPQKVSPVSCSGLSNTVLWQVREPWENREHATADAALYVVGGEGTIRLDGRDVQVNAGSFVQVPRGSTYSLSRRGRNPVLIVLATLVGDPCP